MNLHSLLAVCLLATMASAEPFPYANLSGPDGRVPVAHDADGDGDLDLRDVATSHIQGTLDRQLAALRALRQLPKVHYCWPVERDQLIARDPRLFEYVRITGSLGIRGEWGATGADELRAAVELCKPHGATIAINYSPWHSTYGGDDVDPRSDGPEVDRAFELYRTRLQAVKERLQRANAESGASVRVAVLLLDTEKFHVKDDEEEGAEEWNAAIDAKMRPFYTIGKELFPDAPIAWYNRGSTNRRRFTGNEPGDGYSTSLFSVSDVGRTRKHYRWSVNRSPDGTSMPWIDLAAGNVPYPLRTSWQLGAEINIPYYGDYPDEYAPWHAAKVVAFYPNPFCPKYPQWTWNFIAYVKGATSSKPATAGATEGRADVDR